MYSISGELKTSKAMKAIIKEKENVYLLIYLAFIITILIITSIV